MPEHQTRFHPHATAGAQHASPQHLWEHTQRQCDHPDCETLHLGRHSYSFIIGYTTLSASGATYRQCREQQHFHCSHDCAVEHVLTCLTQHGTGDEVRRPLSDEERRILCEETCVICRGAFAATQEAYLYRVVYAMPGWADATHPHPTRACRDEHWCCSPTHAEQSVPLCIAEHLAPPAHE